MRTIALAVGLTLWAATGLAASKSDSKAAAALVKQAEKLYGAGKYLEAAETLEKAQAIDPQPRVLYNLARAYDQAGELQKALTNYQQYIGSSEGTDPVLLKRSSLSVDRIRGLLAQQEETRAKSDAERKQLEEERARAEAQAQEEAKAKQQALEQAEQRRREQLMVEQQAHDRSQLAAWVTAGIGVAALGTGGYFGWQASQAKSRMDAAGTLSDQQQLGQQGRQNALVADVAYGVGVAGAVAAVLLWPKQGRPTLTQIYVGPTGAMVEVKF